MPLTATGELSVACRLGREPAHAARARGQARQALGGWGLGQHTDLAELVVSELVTNALCHGAGLIEMRLSYADGDLRVEIHDSGVGRPVRQHVGADDECGRGLELLDGLIELHGGERGVIDDHAGPGKTVYVALSLQPAREDGGDPVPSATAAACSPAAPSSSLLPLRSARYGRPATGPGASRSRARRSGRRRSRLGHRSRAHGQAAIDMLTDRCGLRERRRATSADGTPLEYGDDRYRPDRVTFTIDNSRPTSAGFPRDLRVLKETS